MLKSNKTEFKLALVKKKLGLFGSDGLRDQ